MTFQYFFNHDKRSRKIFNVKILSIELEFEIYSEILDKIHIQRIE